MDRVLGKLWIGSESDLASPLGALGFVAVLDLRDGRPPVQHEGVVFRRVANRDGDAWTRDQVEKALDFVGEHVRRGKVLVACAAGMSRSASMAIGFLVRSGWDVVEAHERVRQGRA